MESAAESKVTHSPNISIASLAELLRVRTESYEDIAICKHALRFGITHHGGLPVQERLDTHIAIIGRIEDELERRGVLVQRITKTNAF